MSFLSSAILFQGFAPDADTPWFDAVSLTLDTGAVELASTADLPGGDAQPAWSVDLIDEDTIVLAYLGATETVYSAADAFNGFVFSDGAGDLAPIASGTAAMSGLTLLTSIFSAEQVELDLAGARVLPGATITLDLVFGQEGTKGADTMIGGAGDDFFLAGGGDDVLRGKGGGDTLSGEAGSDDIYGGAGIDVLEGGAGADMLKGNAGGDVMSGGAGADVLRGGGGDDQLVGGEDADRLIGGKGADVFRFFSVEEIGSAPGARDEIRDFTPGEDRIDLSAIDAKDFTFGDDAFALVRNFSGDGGELRYLRKKGLLMGDADGDKLADFVIDVDSGLTLDDGDFVL